MEPHVKELLTEYEEIKLLIKDKELRLEELKPLLLKEIPHDKEVESRFGFFSVKSRGKWQYSPTTTALEAEVKDLQKREKADGTAEEVPGTPFIEYRTKE